MGEFSWFPYSVVAFILFGVGTAFYRLPVVRNHSKTATTAWIFLTQLFWGVILFAGYLPGTSLPMILYAAVWGISMSLLVLCQLHAMRHVESNVLFPITSTLSLVVTVVVGLLFFKDIISFWQLLGIVLIVVTIFSFFFEGKRLKYSKHLFLVGATIVSLSALNKVIHKLVADDIDIHAYLIWQYAFCFVFSGILFLATNWESFRQKAFDGVHKAGMLIGTMNFFGNYFWFIALTKGPFSLVSAIHSLYLLVMAGIVYLLFKETMTIKKGALLVGALVAIALIRLG